MSVIDLYLDQCLFFTFSQAFWKSVYNGGINATPDREQDSLNDSVNAVAVKLGSSEL